MTIRLNVDMEMYTVYFNTKDFPDKYVIRKWVIANGFGSPIATDQYHVADTLDAVRKRVPPEMTRMERLEHDDPVIVEVWV